MVLPNLQSPLVGPARQAAMNLLSFLGTSPTPFHAVRTAADKLEAAGFERVSEQDNWEDTIVEGGRYYFTRNQTALLAFTIPKNWKPGAGASMVATHIDSPNLRIRPVSKKCALGYMQVGVETYGGGIWHSWFDRDLSIAGRVIVASSTTGSFTSKLVKIDRPLLRIPTLAIHLDRNASENFKFNTETEFTPILGQLSSQFNAKMKKDHAPIGGPDDSTCHQPLLQLMAEELCVKPDAIQDFELHLYDTQPPCLGGISEEFIFSPRLDNQMNSFCAVEALIESVSPESQVTLDAQAAPANVNVIALFNHEEIGSVSSTGAESSLLPSLLNRLSPTPQTLHQSIARSFLISADMSHGVHPNYAPKHEENHRPQLNGGVVIKTNAGQRYASDAIGSFLIKRLIAKRGGYAQEYEVRNDMKCGSTVGPFLSKMGVRTVDVGLAQLSMHSIRETGGSHDARAGIDLFLSFFEGFADIDKELTV